MILDTCTLLWRSFEPAKLSPKAVRSIDEANTLVVSSISVWEIGVRIKNKKLKIPILLEDLVQRLKQIDKINIVPIDEMLWMDSLALKWDHKDPADRVIVATAKRLGLSLLTPDAFIKSFYKKTVW